MKKQYCAIFLIYSFFNMYVYCQDLPRIVPQSMYTVFSENEGNLTDDQFIDIALLASGSSESNKYTQQVQDYIGDLVSQVGTIENEYERGEDVLRYLHETLFKNYRENQTRLNTVMSSGSYNCVSSAVLYMLSGRAVGLNVQGVRTRDHAFVSVLIDNHIVDVETTNEWGFDPGQKKEFSNSFTGSTGYNYVPPGNYSLRSDISDKQMIGLILQNRIAEYQRVNNHKSSVPLAVDRYALTLSEEARKDMYDTFSNYASQLNGSGQYEKGITFLKEAVSRWDSSQSVISAIEALVHNFILSKIGQGETTAAEDFLLELKSENLLTENAILSDMRMIYDKKTVDYLNSDIGFDEIHQYLDLIYNQSFITRDKWISYTVFNYVKEAELIARDAGWLEAYLFVKEAPTDIRDQRKYLHLLDSCKGNYVITIHNKFADLYNKGEYTLAESVIRNGLSVIPNDRTLLSDLKMIK